MASAATAPEEVLYGGHDPDVHRNKTYVVVALVLAFFTALEVGTYWFPEDFPKLGLIAILMVLMVIKFAAVTAYFMHLKFDKKFLTVTFYSGLILAVAVYIAVLLAFQWFMARPMV